MRQPTTAEVRLDEHNAASFGPAGPSILPFWLSTSRLRSNFVAAEPPGTEDRDQQLRYPGNVGLGGAGSAGPGNQSDEGLNYHDLEGHGAGSLRSAEAARLSTEVNR